MVVTYYFDLVEHEFEAVYEVRDYAALQVERSSKRFIRLDLFLIERPHIHRHPVCHVANHLRYLAWLLVRGHEVYVEAGQCFVQFLLSFDLFLYFLNYVFLFTVRVPVPFCVLLFPLFHGDIAIFRSMQLPRFRFVLPTRKRTSTGIFKYLSLLTKKCCLF